MKFTLKLIPLVITVLFAVSLGGDHCPLYARESDVQEQEEATELNNTIVPIYKLAQKNGLMKYQIGRETIWAVNVEKAANKYRKRRNATHASVFRNEMNGQIFVSVMSY